MTEKVRITYAGGVATIALNRPAVYNAMDDEMITGFRVAAEAIRDDASVRCVVLRGEGPAFLAGGDVALFHQNIDELPALIQRLARELHFGVLALRRMAKPVLASVHGSVAGAGLSLLAACDLAIAAEGTKFTMAYSRIATSPDGGGTFFLARTLGLKKAMELALLSDVFDVTTARDLGIVNWVVPAADLGAETDRVARRLATGPTVCYGETKRLLEQALAQSLETQLEAEVQAFARCARTEDLREGVAAFVAKRKPAFKGR
jgi:2-(1,2-epoxy-1,2-dihydrophenyl)acetyl-CoA isomerase